ncbi:MAG TPA: 50S ribosomal protein L3 [Gammaproteobacteria bacterium]|nr:50S ribosomal protein L3 [Gammaproteobacteria bacterium]
MNDVNTGLIGRKIGMTRYQSIPVTVVKIESNFVSQLVHEYGALQLTTGKKKHPNKAQKGHFQKADVVCGSVTKEFRVDPNSLKDIELGQEFKVNHFKENDFVDVTGTSIGKGFAGTIKRWNFKGQPNSHGNSLSHRVPGSIGQCQDPGKVFKGKKMAGQMGNERCTTQNLTIVRVDEEKQCLLIKGAVPGARNGWVMVKPSIKRSSAGDKK